MSFPKIPFEISLQYRRSPCVLTVFADHLLIEGERLPELIRVERTEKIRFRFWSHFSWGNLVLIFCGKKLKLKVRRESQIFLKLGWLEAWNQCITDPKEAEEHARHKSENLILFMPKIISLVAGSVFLPSTVCAFQTNYTSAFLWILFWVSMLLLTVSCLHSFLRLARRDRKGLWSMPLTYGGIYVVWFVVAVQVILQHSASRDEIILLAWCYLVLALTWCFFAWVYYLPYRQLWRLDQQIRETST